MDRWDIPTELIIFFFLWGTQCYLIVRTQTFRQLRGWREFQVDTSGFLFQFFHPLHSFSGLEGEKCLVVGETNTPSWLHRTHHTRPILLPGASWPCVGVCAPLQEGFLLQISPQAAKLRTKPGVTKKGVSNHRISSQTFLFHEYK